MMMTCEHCHSATMRIVIHGTELWCTACCETAKGPRTIAHGVIGDEIPGGFVQENFGHEPEVFYSKRAMAKRADALGLQPMVRHVPGDQHVPSWSCMDPQTLANATALVGRQATATTAAPDDVPCDTARFEVTAK